MELTRVQDGELGEVVRLANLAYRGGVGWTAEGDWLRGDRLTDAALREDLRRKPEALLLGLREDEHGALAGTVWLEPRGEGTWYLGLLTVDPSLQARGTGRWLLARAEDVAREHGAATIRMTVLNVRDTLLAWYQRRGYTRTGELEPFPYGDVRIGIPTRDDLAFVVLEKRL